MKLATAKNYIYRLLESSRLDAVKKELPTNQPPKLKNIMCANKTCRRPLAQTDGDRITPVNDRVFSGKISDKKKKFNPLYCVHCGRITRLYKKKFQSAIKKAEKFVGGPKLKGKSSPPVPERLPGKSD